MHIPKKIHYFWTGNNIPEKDLRKIIEIKYENPGFEVNIWGNNNVQFLVNETLRKIKFKYHGSKFDIGEFSVNFSYKNIENAFTCLYSEANRINSAQEAKLVCLNYLNKEREKNIRRYGNTLDLIKYLQHVYYLNLKGNYRNYASASDIARLVILYIEGGIYLDTDVELDDTDIRDVIERKSAKFLDLRLRSDVGIGDCSGIGWLSGVPYNEFGNAIIASLPKSKKIFDILLQMAMTLKRFHLSTQVDNSPQINQIPQYHQIDRLRQVSEEYKMDKKIDLALNFQKSHQLHLDMRCGLQNSVWRTGFNEFLNNNSEKDCANRRVYHTSKMTGPDFLDKQLNPRNKENFPKKYKLKSRKHDSVFRDVDDSGYWANPQYKTYSDDES
ncbi:hypothetical protein ID856_07345 [Xenorhabdus sp. 18]|uniref:glycosyltransferase n=1 Tax=Xenorhabdus doucetiae TaxID=351671 RepID=UPI0019C8E998|nr:glycosyltransferase [Xenorhabdus sp. 18]MBD2796353.1 hypothetical protein [Xenorhabdus sp. 18]